MAKGEETFEQFCERRRQAAVPATRQIDVKEQKRYFLIVSEGARTEPIYFQYFKDRLPNHALDTIDIQPGGRETVRVVELAVRLREKRRVSSKPPYTEVWAVFDKDDFSEESFNRAIELSKQARIEHAASNEAFELWYVLHFQYLDTAITRDQYFEILSKLLGFKYEKNSAQVVEHLFQQGDFKRAIQWARKLEELHSGKSSADSCPYTRVYLLVERLAAYLKL